MTSGFIWESGRSPVEAWTKMFDAYHYKLAMGLLSIAHRRAIDIQNWMKTNAPWTNRTGNARAGLSVDVYAASTVIMLVLTIGRHPEGGTLHYGKYLELAHGGQYAIVGPAVDLWGPVILADAQRFLR